MTEEQPGGRAPARIDSDTLTLLRGHTLQGRSRYAEALIPMQRTPRDADQTPGRT
ncbi:hypothetical protein HUT18_32210 [Streptomyces sp. NA04227]|uniref:hypothetical protein n=1 Tax=Streptomyces sp. NA04227 TaxID=2742136 RepID=UPI00158FD170|nr:hypothetical protein [Streptomyces sp. NA04227]QKW10385.1 hypothetical protein HUT18_32210 [Streptomyces sp. NA04227]